MLFIPKVEAFESRLFTRKMATMVNVVLTVIALFVTKRCRANLSTVEYLVWREKTSIVKALKALQRHEINNQEQPAVNIKLEFIHE